ncbi:MAG TPA: CHAT domain-containing protein, partial [Rhodothermales bacterium]
PQPLDADTIRNDLLDEDTTMLVYGFGVERCFLWSITSGGIEAFVLPERSRIEKLGRKVYDVWSRRTSWATDHAEPFARELSDRLLKPAAKDLGRRRLVVIGEGVFSFLPFAALPDPRYDPEDDPVPLIEHHEILRLPSASVLATLRRSRSTKTLPTGLVAVLADPVFSLDDPRVQAPGAISPDNQGSSAGSPPSPLERSAEDLGITEFERLLHSRTEAANILALVPPEKGFLALDFDASRGTVLSGRLRDYQMIHFATHGLLNTEHAELSGLVLSRVSEQGVPVNGFLRVHEIYDLDLRADLVTLSACKTGLGEDVRGEGLVGLVQAFLYAGARRAVVSLWNVSDHATAELMIRLYRGIFEDGLHLASALREAQLSMLREEFWSPKDWAGFVVYGDWQ